MSCLFLNAGLTYLDRQPSPDHWQRSLTTIQRAFLDVLRMDWNFFDREGSIAQKTFFLTLSTTNALTNGMAQNLDLKATSTRQPLDGTILQVCSTQLAFRAHRRIQACACIGRGPSSKASAVVRYVTSISKVRCGWC